MTIMNSLKLTTLLYILKKKVWDLYKMIPMWKMNHHSMKYARKYKYISMHNMEMLILSITWKFWKHETKITTLNHVVIFQTNVEKKRSAIFIPNTNKLQCDSPFKKIKLNFNLNKHYGLKANVMDEIRHSWCTLSMNDEIN